MMTKKLYLDLWNKSYLRLSDLENYEELTSISSSINSSLPRQILFHVINDLVEIPKCSCGNNLPWHADNKNYRQFCSKKCTATYTSDQRKNTNLKKYGIDHYSKTDQFSAAIKDTNLKKYGIDHYSKTTEFKQRVADTNLKIYGVHFPMQNPSVGQTVKNQWIEKYAVDNPSKLDSTKNKIKNTNLKKYGVECVLQSSSIKEAIKQTNIEKYGVPYASQNLDISKKIANSRKENYYPADILFLLKDKDWLHQKNLSGNAVHEIAKELDVSSSNLCKIFHQHGIDIVRHFKSSYEKIISTFLDQHGITYVCNDRKIISPYELDIVIPQANLAIEINGAYWHHEDQGKHKNYHALKTSKSKDAGYDLWQFFDWEMDNKKEIILSKLAQRLGISKKIHARKLSVKILTSHEKNNFLEKNHLQGSCVSKINLGLVDNHDNIYAVMTFGSSRFNQNYSQELLRFCSLTNHTVVGGASKLLTYFQKNIAAKDDSLVSYCNLRFSSGNLYDTLGFKKIQTSPPNYYYVSKNGQYAGTRNQWQKHMLKTKLPNFDPALTERENMKMHGYHRIWDCGQAVYLHREN